MIEILGLDVQEADVVAIALNNGECVIGRVHAALVDIVLLDAYTTGDYTFRGGRRVVFTDQVQLILTDACGYDLESDMEELQTFWEIVHR